VSALDKLAPLPLLLQGQPFTNPGSSEPLYLGGPGTPVTISPSGWLVLLLGQALTGLLLMVA
jgi:hypothetical protein